MAASRGGGTEPPAAVYVIPSFKSAFAELTAREFSFRRRFNHVVHGYPALSPDKMLARLLDVTIFIVVCISTLLFVVETLDDYYDPAGPQGFFYAGEAFCVLMLTGDMALRIAASISVDDIVNLRTFIDTVSILGFYLSLFTDSFGLGNNELSSEFLRVLRMMRLARMAHLFQRTELGMGFIIVARTLNLEMRKGLIMMVLLVIIAWISLATLFFNAENSANTWDAKRELWIQPDGSPTPFQTIPACFWFVSLTMATVGYGDVYPVSSQGRLMAFVIMCCGVMFLALPTMIVGATFEALHRGGNQAKAQLRLGKFFRKVRCCVRLIAVWREMRRTGSSRLLMACTLEDYMALVPAGARPAADLCNVFFPLDYLEADVPLHQRMGLELPPAADLKQIARNGLTASDLLLRLLTIFSGCCTTRELIATVRTHTRDGILIESIRRIDVACLAFALAKLKYLRVFVLQASNDDLLLGITPESLRRADDDDPVYRCVRNFAEASRMWRDTTGESLADIPRLVRDGAPNQFNRHEKTWEASQRHIAVRSDTDFEYDHKQEPWVANEVLGGFVVDGDSTAHHLCEACLHCLPPPKHFRGDRAALEAYKRMLQVQMTLVEERHAALEERRKSLNKRASMSALAIMDSLAAWRERPAPVNETDHAINPFTAPGRHTRFFKDAMASLEEKQYLEESVVYQMLHHVAGEVGQVLHPTLFSEAPTHHTVDDVTLAVDRRIFMPCLIDRCHWILATWVRGTSDAVTIELYNSSVGRGIESSDERTFVNKLSAWIRAKWIDVHEVHARQVAGPQQEPGSNDCGVFVINNAARVAGGDAEWTRHSIRRHLLARGDEEQQLQQPQGAPS